MPLRYFGDRVLVVGAHPDDLEMNAGGTVRKLMRAGVDVRTLTLSSDDAGRVAESTEAQRRLGVVSGLYGFGVDTRLADRKVDLILYVDGLIKEMHPDTVVTHFWADTHQDHVTAYEVVQAAARNVRNVLMFKPTFPSGRTDVPFHPNFVSVLDQEDVATKSWAIKAFVSQMKKYGEDRWLASLLATAAGDAWTYGGYHGYAEVFQVSRLVW